MDNETPELDVYTGWDNEKAEYFETTTCPLCGYRVTTYEKGLTIVEQERDPKCTCCSGPDPSPSASTPYASGDSSGDSQDEGLGCVLAFFAILLLIGVAISIAMYLL